jgi:hypothetical protein
LPLNEQVSEQDSIIVPFRDSMSVSRHDSLLRYLTEEIGLTERSSKILIHVHQSNTKAEVIYCLFQVL